MFAGAITETYVPTFCFRNVLPVQSNSLLIFGSFIFSTPADAWQSGDAAKEHSVAVTYRAAGLKSLKDRYPHLPQPPPLEQCQLNKRDHRGSKALIQ